jgi:hypothetical protein
LSDSGEVIMAIVAIAESKVVGQRKIIFGQARRTIILGRSELGILWFS